MVMGSSRPAGGSVGTGFAAGVPAVVKRELAGTPAEMWIKLNPTHYPALARRHIAGIKPITK